MIVPSVEQLVADYILRLERAASTLPPRDRADLIEKVRKLIDTAKEAGTPSDEAGMRTLLDRLGEPEAIVALEEWWVASTDRIEGAANDLGEALESVLDALREARSRRLAGAGIGDITKGLVARGGRETRLAPTVAFREFQAALTDCRASMIRALVDEEQMTFTEVGELIGVSRQMVARLYRRAGDSGPATEGEDEG